MTPAAEPIDAVPISRSIRMRERSSARVEQLVRRKQCRTARNRPRDQCGLHAGPHIATYKHLRPNL